MGFPPFALIRKYDCGMLTFLGSDESKSTLISVKTTRYVIKDLTSNTEYTVDVKVTLRRNRDQLILTSLPARDSFTTGILFG